MNHRRPRHRSRLFHLLPSGFQSEAASARNTGMGEPHQVPGRTFHKIVKMWSVAESCVSEFRAAPGDTCVSKFRVTPGDTCPDRAIRIPWPNLASATPPSSRQKKRLLFCSLLLSLSQKLLLQSIPVVFICLDISKLIFLLC